MEVYYYINGVTKNGVNFNLKPNGYGQLEVAEEMTDDNAFKTLEDAEAALQLPVLGDTDQFESVMITSITFKTEKVINYPLRNI